ncbi:hypothetical protein UY3_13635 [Chelonia mydas]|uniref:Uncharacterized protein n=1 Tax=Chelonia mydas TaxID=8469 RepID=M7B1F8_CHEMY|nr:hypothetical protein UY3_13635 [Chelonia mydas]
MTPKRSPINSCTPPVREAQAESMGERQQSTHPVPYYAIAVMVLCCKLQNVHERNYHRPAFQLRSFCGMQLQFIDTSGEADKYLRALFGPLEFVMKDLGSYQPWNSYLQLRRKFDVRTSLQRMLKGLKHDSSCCYMNVHIFQATSSTIYDIAQVFDRLGDRIENADEAAKSPVAPYRLTDVLEHKLLWVNIHFVGCIHESLCSNTSVSL